MVKMIIRRLIGMVLLLFIIMTLTFILLRAAPGSPFTGERAFPEPVLEALNKQYGLDKPWHVQYFNYMKGLLKGDLGPSTRYVGRTVNEIIWEHLPKSIVLGLTAYIFALLVGLTFGVLAALKQNSALDAFAADAAILISLLLQYGASPAEIGHALRRAPSGEPATLIGAQYFKHTAARQASYISNIDRREREGRQYQVARPAPARRRQPVEREREHQNQ